MAADLDIGVHSYMQVPPDSTGKRIETSLFLAVEYGSGTIAFLEGDEVTGFTSGAIGTVVHLREGSTTSAGTIYVVLKNSSLVQDFGVAENLQVDAVTNAVVVSTLGTYTNKTTNVSADNPLNGQNVDQRGAAFVRYQGGDQQLGAFGPSKFAEDSQLAAYTHYYDEEPNEWYDNISGGGASLTHLPNESSVALDIGTVSGEIASRTTHRYHVYQPGFGQLVLMTVTVGDTGKANVRRRWGYFDSNNGCFFELTGTTLNIGIRSNVTGTPSDVLVPQVDWNGDRVDGGLGPGNLSRVLLDVSKNNVYWIDFQWLGAGRVRFGIFSPAGDRVLLHTFEHANSITTPWCTTPVLPIRWSMDNTGTSGSPSRLKLTCASVQMEGRLVPELSRRSVKWDSAKPTKTTTAEVPIISFRSKLTINSIRNSKTTILESFTAYVKTQACRVRVYLEPTDPLGGAPSWSSVRVDAAAEQDTAATSFTGGKELLSFVLGIGTHNVDLPDNFGLLGLAMRLKADEAQTLVFTFTVESLEGTDTVTELSVTGIDI